MNWRLASRLSVITFAVLVVIIVAVVQHNATGASTQQGAGLQGVDLGGKAAPNFQLADQNGKRVSLGQFRGTPVVLTFLYTHCPDVCPLTAEHLHTTLQSLGSDAKKVTVLAVSTDPKRDNAEAALTFSRAHNMQDAWHFLIGQQEELAPVWSSYRVYAQEQQQTVNHTSALYVIDKQGNERVYMDGGDFKPDDLAANLRILLNEK